MIASENNGKKYQIDVDRIDGEFSGTGDLFSSLFLAMSTIHE
jgi:pyridoxal/pyridoxine/pyridoxamine kinase